MVDAGPAPTLLRDHTTLRLGGTATRFVSATTEADLIEVVRSADAAGEPLLVLGGGSNLVAPDAGVPGTVCRVATTGVRADRESGAGPACGGVLVTVAAGEDWDALVARTVERGWVGMEALAGIPGSVGATPVQNVGAYGQDVALTVARVRTWDRRAGEVRSYAGADCGFGYRHSRFKAEPGRHVVLDVTFQLAVGGPDALGAPVAYAELARTLGIEVGARAPAREVRAAVLGLRRAKGMVLDADDHDTWSAGSFFTNPVVAPEELPEGAPSWPVEGRADRVKTSAAWLIDHAGFAKGHPGPGGRVSLSTKHPLALTNRGDGTTEDLLALAREVRDGVLAAYAVELVNEPVLLGTTL